ncbi:MAG: Serine/threonine-protein kinase pkn1 [Pseudomonadota bacterium]
MTHFRNKLTTVVHSSGYLAVAALAWACGNTDSNNPAGGPSVTETPVVIPPVERESCEDNSLLAECQGQAVTPPPGDAPRGDAAALAKAAAENILAANCGQCHGPDLSKASAKAGMNFINDIDRLVEDDKIVPLDSARSLIVQRMLRGEMPPPGSGVPSATLADIDVVSSYIDNPVFWPGYAPVAARSCVEDGVAVSFDDLFQEIQKDLARQDNDDTRFLRYISLTNRVSAGVCTDAALDRDRQGMVKMLNMLSTRSSIELPVAINTEETIYRIDLRDFDWDRDIDVGGQGFVDGWEAIAENNPYAVRFEGDDADDVIEDTETDFPVMFADQMMNVAMIGNLYYGLIGVDGNGQLQDFVQDTLGIDTQADIDDEEAIRAGTTRSRVSRQDRVIERHDMGLRAGAYWQSFDFGANDSSDIFTDPFDFEAGGTEAIFTLPNGMLAYIIADENDNIVEDSDILLDTNQNNFRAVTAVSCSNCHATGFIPAVDEVGEFTAARSRQLRLNRDEIDAIEAIYVSPEVFADKALEDSVDFYQFALKQAKLPTTGGDAVSNVFLRFEDRVQLADAAGDFGVTPAELTDTLNLLEPEFAVLRRGTLDRDDFTNLYVEALCEMTSVLENRPEAGLCN